MRLKMAQDDHKNRSGNSSSGSGSSKSSKKLKRKKVPQRGLGVAQLEKIRLEEHQKKKIVSQKNNPILSPNFRQNLPTEIDSNSIFKTDLGSNFPNKALNLGQGVWDKLWNGEHINEGKSYRSDQSGGFAFKPNLGENYESTMKKLFQPQNSSSSMVKVSSGSSLSSVITYNQMEPPSNQSFYSRICASSKWPDEEKMIGIKRQYPFSLDNSSGPSNPSKYFNDRFQNPVNRSFELPSCANGGLVHVESRKPRFGEGLASLSMTPEMRTKKVTEKNGDLNGDFLTLALPEPSLPHPAPELSETGLKLQENVDGPSLYSFFPSSNALNAQATDTITSCSGEVIEKLDLNLKL